MKLNLSNLITFQNSIKVATPKTGENKQDSLFFNFNENKIYFGNTLYIGYVHFSYKLDFENEKYTNFYINVQKFLLILKDFKEIENVHLEFIYKKETDRLQPIFKKGKDNYIITHEIGTYAVDLPDNEESIKVSITQEVLNKIQEAVKFVDLNKDSFSSVYVEKGIEKDNHEKYLYCVTLIQFFRAKIDNYFPNIIIHKLFADIISTVNEEFDFYYSNGYSLIEIPEKIKIYFSNSKNKKIIPDEKDFEPVISFDYKITVNTKDFINLLSFFQPFYSAESKPIGINIKEDAENEIELVSISERDKITKSFKVEYISKELLGYFNRFNSSILKDILKTYSKDETIDIYIHPDKLGLVVSNNIKEKYIMTMRVKG